MSMIEVKVPDIGDFKEVEIIELLVNVGDTIKIDQSLITVCLLYTSPSPRD